jgi:hypothetical protein
MNDTVIMISSEFFGRGDDELGRKLMGSFLRKLSIDDKQPGKIIFVNSGVKLLSEDSPVRDGIDLLIHAGIDLVACGTCVQHYNLGNKIKPEYVSDMRSIISILMKSDNVITI